MFVSCSRVRWRDWGSYEARIVVDEVFVGEMPAGRWEGSCREAGNGQEGSLEVG